MSGSTTATKNTSATNAYAANMAARSAFIANSQRFRVPLPAIAVTSGTSNYAVPLLNQGCLVGIDLRISLTVHNATASSAVPQPGAPYNFVSNLNFVDQANVTRHNLSGHGLYDWLNMRSMNSVPFDSAASLAEGGSFNTGLSYPLTPTIAAGTSGTVDFIIHVPISRGWNDLTGIIPLATGNQNQPAVLNVQLTSLLGAVGDSPYNQVVTITGGSISAVMNYYQPKNMQVALPPLDAAAQFCLVESQPDNTNLIAGQIKQINLQTQFLTKGFLLRYYNGAAFTYGSDVASMALAAENGTVFLDSTLPLFRFVRFRNHHGFDTSPGVYNFDFIDAPVYQPVVGTWVVNVGIATVNAGAYMTYLYDYDKMPGQIGPAVNQVG